MRISDWSSDVCSSDLARRSDALPVYARLVELCPEDAVHWGNYATVLRQDGQLAEAERAVDASLRLDPGNAEQWINRGLLQFHEIGRSSGRERVCQYV